MTDEPTPKQGWTWQEGIDFEVAIEIINDVIGVCSWKIGQQRRATQPDRVVVDAWMRESRVWAARQHALDSHDVVAVAAARDEAIARIRYLEAREIP